MGVTLIVTGYFFCIFVGSLFVSLIFKIIKYQEAKSSGIKKAGMIIGFLKDL